MIPTIRLVGLGLAAAVVVSCGSDDQSSAGDSAGDPIDVVVTHSVLGDVIGSAFGEVLGDVQAVIPVGADPHVFAPSSRQAVTMEEADLVIANGLGFEAGLQPVLDAVADAGTPVIEFSDLVGVHEADEVHDDEVEHETDDDHDEEFDVGHPHNTDSHIFLDPVLVITGVQAVGDLLVDTGADPAEVHAAVDSYVAEIEAAIADADATLATIPDDRRELVTNHRSFRYFADRFGLSVLDTVIPAATTSAQASASHLEDLVDAMEAHEVPAIFVETSESPRLARSVADSIGDVEVVVLFGGSLGDVDSGADTYVGLIRTNAERVAAVLGTDAGEPA